MSCGHDCCLVGCPGEEDCSCWVCNCGRHHSERLDDEEGLGQVTGDGPWTCPYRGDPLEMDGDHLESQS